MAVWRPSSRIACIAAWAKSRITCWRLASENEVQSGTVSPWDRKSAIAATPLWVGMCCEASYQFSQREQSRSIHPGAWRLPAGGRWRPKDCQRLRPGGRDENPRAIWQLDIELGFTRLSMVASEHLNDLTIERVLRIRDPHQLLLHTSYCGSILLAL
jgi:hypothetical protein